MRTQAQAASQEARVDLIRFLLGKMHGTKSAGQRHAVSAMQIPRHGVVACCCKVFAYALRCHG